MSRWLALLSHGEQVDRMQSTNHEPPTTLREENSPTIPESGIVRDESEAGESVASSEPEMKEKITVNHLAAKAALRLLK